MKTAVTTTSSDINWNYLAYLCIIEKEKWSNYAGSIPGTPIYAKFCYCAQYASTVVFQMESKGMYTYIEQDYLDSVIAKYNIGLTANELRNQLSDGEAAELLSSEYDMRRKPSGAMAAYVSSNFFLTEEEISKYDATRTYLESLRY